MATIDSRDMVQEFIEANGHYSSDPPVLAIVEYRNSWGQIAWGVMYEADPIDRYAESYDVRQPRLVFLHRAHEGCWAKWPAVCLGPGVWAIEPQPMGEAA